jgi:hypothetical protein
MDLPQLGATHERRLDVRASRGSREREGSEPTKHGTHDAERRTADRPEGESARRSEHGAPSTVPETSRV